VWEPRIARVVRAWLDVEWLSVAAGIRECGLEWISPDALPTLIPMWEAARLSAIQLKLGDDAAESPAGLICVAVGAQDKVEQLRLGWAARDDEAVGALLGYPACCRAFFRDVWMRQRCLDTTWAMAENTSLRQVNGIAGIALPEDVPPWANILWRWLGVRAVPHLPCRFDCSPSIAFGRSLLEVGGKAGYAEEVAWIEEILSWPVEWSALHGIAEVKSPIMKLVTRTDATAEKWVVQWAGTGYPGEGAVGLHFPYQPPKRPMLTRSREYQRGLAHSTTEETDPTWRYADNGFSSAEAMNVLHQPIVALTHKALAYESGNVLDLGCGNGTLLAKVCERGNLIPYGVDSNGFAVEHARLLLPQFADNFVQADLFDIERWDGGTRRYALALLMLGRLLEVPGEVAMRMLHRLRLSSSRVLVYAYPDWGGQPLEAMARQLGLEVEESGCSTAAWLTEAPVKYV
jgi:SAM-dependent methyltransferase